MKRFLLLALGVFFAMPAAVGLFDAWCYTLLGAQATGLDWTGGRSMVAHIFGTLSIVPILIGMKRETAPRIIGYQPRPGSNVNPPPTYARPAPPPNPPQRRGSGERG